MSVVANDFYWARANLDLQSRHSRFSDVGIAHPLNPPASVGMSSGRNP